MEESSDNGKEETKPVRLYLREAYELNVIAAKLTRDTKIKHTPADVVRKYWDKVKDWGKL